MSLEKLWQKRFSRFAIKYNEDHLIAGWSRQGLQRRLETYLKIFKKLDLPKDALILDLGCGAGTYCRALNKLGYRNIIGLDYSFAVLKKAQRKINNIPLINADVYNLPFKNQTFNHIICIGVFQALTNEKAALLEIKRVLKKGGILILGILNATEIYYLLRKKIRPDPGMQNLRRYRLLYLKNLMSEMGFLHFQSQGIFIFPEKFSFLYKIFPKFFPLPFELAHSILITCKC